MSGTGSWALSLLNDPGFLSPPSPLATIAIGRAGPQKIPRLLRLPFSSSTESASGMSSSTECKVGRGESGYPSGLGRASPLERRLAHLPNSLRQIPRASLRSTKAQYSAAGSTSGALRLLRSTMPGFLPELPCGDFPSSRAAEHLFSHLHAPVAPGSDSGETDGVCSIPRNNSRVLPAIAPWPSRCKPRRFPLVPYAWRHPGIVHWEFHLSSIQAHS